MSLENRQIHPKPLFFLLDNAGACFSATAETHFSCSISYGITHAILDVFISIKILMSSKVMLL